MAASPVKKPGMCLRCGSGRVARIVYGLIPNNPIYRGSLRDQPLEPDVGGGVVFPATARAGFATLVSTRGEDWPTPARAIFAETQEEDEPDF
jgi:hypothetical protein